MTFQFTALTILLTIICVPLLVLCVLQALLVNPRQYDATTWTWVRRFFMVLLLLIISFQPTIKTHEEFESMTDLSVVFVVDTTGSMSAIDGIVEDTDENSLTLGTRLDEVRSDINFLISALPPAKFSAITFNSTASVDLPLTHDTSAVQSWANTLRPEITAYSSGSDLSVPVDTISMQINRIYARYPQDKVLLILMSDGDVNTDSGVERYQELDARVYGGAAIVYGTAEGAKMRQYRPNLNAILNPSLNEDLGKTSSYSQSSQATGEDDYIIDPETGEIAISKSNYSMMKAISENVGIPCIERLNSTRIHDFAQSVFTHEWRNEPVHQTREISNQIVWPFSLAFVVLLLWELLVVLMFKLSRVGGKQ
jgi:Ca-activated chloride channel family protein